jgi:hypothetical protein
MTLTRTPHKKGVRIWCRLSRAQGEQNRFFLSENAVPPRILRAKPAPSGGQTMSSRRFHGLGLVYATIPVLAGAYSAFEVATTSLERHTAVNWLTIFVPRLGLAFVLALLVYGLFRAAGSLVERLHGVAVAAQPTWRFITSKPSAADP